MKKIVIIITTIIVIFALIAIYNNLLTINPKIAVKLGQNINKTDKNGNTALMMTNNLKVVKTLIELGADINATNNDYMTALMLAVQKGDIDITKELINAGADVAIKSHYQTAFTYATEKCIEELFNTGECANNTIQIINLLTESKTGSNDIDIQKIKNINDLISKQKYTAAAKFSTELDIPIKFFVGNQIIKNLLEKNKIIEARKIVENYYSFPANMFSLLEGKIDLYEISIIKEDVNPLLNENKFVEARKKIEDSSLNETKKIYLIFEIDNQENSILQPKIRTSLNENNFAEARKIIKSSSLSLGYKDKILSEINYKEKDILNKKIGSLLSENKFVEARKAVKNSSLPKDDKNELIQVITSRETSSLQILIQIYLDGNEFAKARKEIRNSSLSEYAKNELMREVNRKEKTEEDRKWEAETLLCVEWRQILRQQKIRLTISRDEYYYISDNYVKKECGTKVSIYDMGVAQRERERLKSLGW